MIERYHATFRERDKVIRGFKSEKTADKYIENWKTYYNFVKPHMALNGLTPSDVAGINPELTEIICKHFQSKYAKSKVGT